MIKKPDNDWAQWPENEIWKEKLTFKNIKVKNIYLEATVGCLHA